MKDRVHDGNEVSKDDLYGSWVQVTNCRKKPQTRKDLGGMAGAGGTVGHSTGSRFSAMSQLNDIATIEDNRIGKVGQNGYSMRTLGSDLARGKSVYLPHVESSKINEKCGELLQPGKFSNKQQGVLVQHGSIPNEVGANISRNSLSIAFVDQVKVMESSLSKGNHVAIQVVAPMDNMNPKVRNERILPISITGSGGSKGQGISTGVSKKGVRSKKKDPKSGTRLSLACLVENLSIELERAQSNIVQHGTDLSAPLSGEVDDMQWQENTAFDTAGFEDMQD
ncbi:hypothetical protein V6N13_028512 [Hibiscus sabdariffa]|uniref:Uncharacterized protein n=1 Tax=Hibiscus sabdariffa TaxID=183260 RepID=A0ABR2DA75_9ROSI